MFVYNFYFYFPFTVTNNSKYKNEIQNRKQKQKERNKLLILTFGVPACMQSKKTKIISCKIKQGIQLMMQRWSSTWIDFKWKKSNLEYY